MFGSSAFSSTPFSSLSGGQTVVALTGVSATGSVGSVSPNIVIGLTGVSATGSVGTVTTSQAVSKALSGVQATGSVGTRLGMPVRLACLEFKQQVVWVVSPPAKQSQKPYLVSKPRVVSGL